MTNTSRRKPRAHRPATLCTYFSLCTLLVSFLLPCVDNNQCSGSVTFWCGTDPKTRIRTTDLWIWIRLLLFSSVTFKMQTKKNFFPNFICLLIFEGTFTSFFQDKNSQVTKQSKTRFFLLFLLDDRRIWIRTSD
jgi:hypothetical protein